MDELSPEEARRRIQKAGLRVTAPRIALLQLLTGAQKALSHSEVVDSIGAASWDQATLYRNLVKFVSADLAQVVSKVGGVARYLVRVEDEEPHHHPHFSCRNCGTVECLPEVMISAPAPGRWNHSLQASELQLVGDCPDCIEAK